MNINQNPNFRTHNTSVRPGKIEYIKKASGCVQVTDG